VLPEVRDTAGDFGVALSSVFGAAAPIRAVVGDQQAAAIGQACFAVGEVKSTYGTGAFLLLNTGEVLVRSRARLLGTIAYRLAGRMAYALEGSILSAGATITPVWVGGVRDGSRKNAALAPAAVRPARRTQRWWRPRAATTSPAETNGRPAGCTRGTEDRSRFSNRCGPDVSVSSAERGRRATSGDSTGAGPTARPAHRLRPR
jgi:hypothetical protein